MESDMSTNTPEACLATLQDTANLLQKAQTNLRKCPKQRLTQGYIESRIKTINEYWNTFRSAHQQLVKCVPAAKRTECQYFVNEDYFIYEDLYLNILGDLKDLLATCKTTTTPTQSEQSSSANVEGQVKLPRITLPTFTGVYEEWTAFKDMFISVVHNNASLSKVQKLHYLKGCLAGEADALLRHVQITEDNYFSAWETLNTRYGNKRLIVSSIMKKLFTQRKITVQTASHIKSLLDTTNECLNNLKNLKISTDSWDPVIIFLVVQKLDPESHREWEEFAYKENSDELPMWNDLKRFLNSKFRTLELIAPPPRDKLPVSKTKEYTVHASTTESFNQRNCLLCNENHALYHCREFKTKTPTERCDYAKKENLCFNCLSLGHPAAKCRMNMTCHVCHKRHHTLVHLTQTPNPVQVHHGQVEEEEEERAEEQSEDSSNVELTSHFTTGSSTALLATALIPVKNDDGLTTVIRALVDPGSQATFISERAAQMLKVKRVKAKGNITGVGSTKTTVKQSTEVEILSNHDKTFSLKVKAYIMPTQITKKLPSQAIKSSNWPHLDRLILADPSFNQPGRVDMLLGVDVCAQIMKSEVIKGPPGTPCAQDTCLGWILFGSILDEGRENDMIVMHARFDAEELIKTMWELDKHETKTQTIEERKCEEIYQQTYSRTEDGRYIVKLPTKTENLLSTQGETRDIALKRLHQLERRMEKDKKLKEEYTKVMEEYKIMNHMEEVPDEELNKPSVYLPHHAVVKEEKETTKVRTVFNASQEGKNGISLNAELLVGPQLQNNMRHLLIKWRMKKVCFVADIQKMYRQILVKKEDKDLQRVLWRSDKTEPVKDYRLTRVTFGTASAPYLAVKTLHQLADDEGKDHPAAAAAIKQDFYVDDLMSSGDTLQTAVNLGKDIDMILRKGGFVLQKWCSNNPEFLKEFPAWLRSSHVHVDISVDGTIRALGVSWNMGKDVFEYSLRLPPLLQRVITKRNILGDIQRLFDPLGWLAPAILPAKVLVQRLWLRGITWDEEVDTELKDEWLEMRDNLLEINGIEIPRWLQMTERDNFTIHGFCDASTKGYAAVAYVRVENKDKEVKTSLIAAKTRVAPVKPVSLPRLELCGALLLSRLLREIKEATNLPTTKIFAWTDSTIVLSWLLGDPTRWQTFVRNRVVEILDNIGHNWYHVQTTDNPADPASRGCTVSELKNNSKWWAGPEWLSNEDIIYSRPNNLNTDMERKEIQVNLKIKEEHSLASKFEEFENLNELLKTITICKRFLKGKQREEGKPVTTKELDESLKTCVKIVQRDSFEEDINDLKRKGIVRKTSRLKLLQPYLDDEMILRVGGRLRHSDLDEDGKHPIILSNNNHLVVLIVADAHLKTLHGGVQLMLGYLRTRFWILKAKNIVKAISHKCLTCAKHNAVIRTQMMGDLPKERVTPAKPFLHSGVDFAGPYQVLMSKGRGAKTTKAYIAIFVCMSVKAIHLELVGDLTSESFIGAFKRFVSRRGRCAHLWSDQGRNFIGANKELAAAWVEAKLQFDGDIAQTMALDGTQWHFIPAYSPHMGGLWEAGVKSTKHHLKRILTAHCTFEEMSTLLCQIEACLNSRPLSPIDDSDTDNIQVLTPGHFLLGEAPMTIPSPDLTTVPTSHLSRWQTMQKLLNDFWRRWQQEYLSRLQQRPKWLNKVIEFSVGEIVLIKQENLPPGKWSMGRIVKKHPGQDGVTRVYSLKSGDSIIQRASNKLCPLPINPN